MFIEAAERVSKALSRPVTPSQLVLSWAVQRGTIVIPKSSNEARLKQNIDVSYMMPVCFIRQVDGLFGFPDCDSPERRV